MKTVIQRVKSASVTIDGQLISQISKGLLVFAAIGKDDTPKEAESMASKVLKTKFWEDDNGVKWKKNVQEIEGEVLCVSQFTLLASTKKGNKPDFHRSASAAKAKELYDLFFTKVRTLYLEDRVKDGVFQATMDVGLINDGPVGVDYHCDDEAVTLEIDTNPPEMKDVTSLGPAPGESTFTGTSSSGMEAGEGVSFKGRLQRTIDIPGSGPLENFIMPPELLE